MVPFSRRIIAQSLALDLAGSPPRPWPAFDDAIGLSGATDVAGALHERGTSFADSPKFVAVALLRCWLTILQERAPYGARARLCVPRFVGPRLQ